MARVEIYGASDDLCEIVGDINEEFCNDGNGNAFQLLFDDGTIIQVHYGADSDGLWHVTPLVSTASSVFTRTFTATDPDSDQYSDRATLEGAFSKVRHRMVKLGAIPR